MKAPDLAKSKKVSDTTGKSIDSTAVYYFIASIDSMALQKFHHIDTSLTNFYQYDVNFRNHKYYAGKGNMGQHSLPLKFDYTPSEGFNYAPSFIEHYMYKLSDIKYYKLYKPFTEIYYFQGPEKEKNLEVTHSQNLMPRLNAGIHFRYIVAPGLYQNQESDNKNLYITLRYHTENSRYGFILNYLHNKMITQENGGISDKEAFEENIESDRLLINVNLVNAENVEKKGGFYLNHYFNIAKPQKIIKDTITNTVKRKGFRFGRLTHSVLYETNTFSFSDNLNSPDSTYFKQFDTADSTITFDSISIRKFENQIIWSNLDYDEKPDEKAIYFYFGIKNQFVSIKDSSSLNREYSQMIPKAGFSIYAFKSSRLTVNGYYVLSGDYNKDDFGLTASLNQFIGTKEKNYGLLELEGGFSQKSPDLFYTYYKGNNIRWENNDFEKENALFLKGQYSYKSLKAGLAYYLLDQYIYLDGTAHPKQSNDAISILRANLNYILKHKDWTIDIDLTYQKTSDNTINLPDFIGSANLYLTKNLFQGAAIIQPGIDVFYNTSYYADSYMPALRSFYSQSTQKIGNKIYAGVFLNARVKRTLFFVRYEHLNALFSKAYYMTPNYPMQDAIFRFGLTWKFYD